MTHILARRALAEFVGTAFLVASDREGHPIAASGTDRPEDDHEQAQRRHGLTEPDATTSALMGGVGDGGQPEREVGDYRAECPTGNLSRDGDSGSSTADRAQCALYPNASAIAADAAAQNVKDRP